MSLHEMLMKMLKAATAREPRVRATASSASEVVCLTGRVSDALTEQTRQQVREAEEAHKLMMLEDRVARPQRHRG